MTLIKTSKAEVQLQGENHIRVTIHENAELDLADVKEINKAKSELIGDKKYTVLFIPGNYTTINSEARHYSASAHVYHNAIAKAILVKNTTHRLIGNFFIKVNHPPAPTLLFTSEIEAMEWLDGLRHSS